MSPSPFVAALLLIAALLEGCTGVVETRAFSPGYGRVGDSCATPFGAYYLPKALVKISVQRKISAETKVQSIAFGPENLSRDFVADPGKPACLDYLQSATSDDKVRITRDENGLLASIRSDVEDRTPDIAIKLINVAANAAISARADAGAPSDTISDQAALAFDPFDHEQLAVNNAALRRFGLCLYVENESFDPRTQTPQRWCSERRPPAYLSRLAAFSQSFDMTAAPTEGVLYRPNISHKVVVMRKEDPEGRGPWLLAMTKRLDMPNISPVFSLNIQRAFFTRNETEVTFNKGVLADVSVKKGSELYGFAAIPLALAMKLEEIPGQILKFRIADTTADAKLLEAEIALLRATQEYAALANKPWRTSGPDLMQPCIDAEGASECQRLSTGGAQ